MKGKQLLLPLLFSQQQQEDVESCIPHPCSGKECEPLDNQGIPFYPYITEEDLGAESHSAGEW